MDASPFNTLPAELRNRIYELVVTQSDDINIDWNCRAAPTKLRLTNKSTCESPSKKYCRSDKCRAKSNAPRRSILALAETCKHMRAETLPVFLQKNRFVFTHMQTKCWALDSPTYFDRATSQRYASMVETWIANFGQYFQNIKHITVDFGPIGAASVDQQAIFLESLRYLKGVASRRGMEVDLLGGWHYWKRRGPAFNRTLNFNSLSASIILEQLEEAIRKHEEQYGKSNVGPESAERMLCFLATLGKG